jgi:hypothetical protein
VNSTEQNSDRLIHLYARGSAIGVEELTDKGALHLVDLPQVRIHRKQIASGLFCW